MKPVRVYIAGPYSLGDVCVNIRRVLAMADQLLAAGYIPYVPHLNHLWHLLHPHPHEEWLRLDCYWLDCCDVLLRMPGESAGSDIEVAYAAQRGRPAVVTSVDELLRRFPTEPIL